MEHSHRCMKKPLQGQRGAVVIWFALLLPVLVGFTALAIDLSRLGMTKAELQNAADAAALGGARSLSNAGGSPYNWTAAANAALAVAQRNVANADQIEDAQIETGYWNLDDPSLGFRDNSVTPVAGDVAAVRTTITISRTHNNGPLPFFFAPIFSYFDDDDHANQVVQATATAVLPVASKATNVFPLVINKYMYDTYWDTETNLPKNDPSTGTPYVFKYGTNVKYSGQLSGNWTAFDIDDPSECNPCTIKHSIQDGGNSTPLGIGDDIWISKLPVTSSEKQKYEDIYSYVKANKDVAIYVVDNLVATNAGAWQPIYAIAGFHISKVVSVSGKKTIQGYFLSNYYLKTATPGSATVAFGAYTPARLVQ